MRLDRPLLLLSYLFIFLLFFLPPIDTDLGWHLRYGEYFLENRSVLKTNEFAYFMPGHFWAYSATIYQAILAFIYKTSGLVGLSAFYAAVMALCFLGFQKINQRLPKTSFIGFLVIVFFGWVVFAIGIRPQIFTFIGLVILFLFIKEFDKRPKFILITPILFALWANIHGGFVLGLFLLAAFGAQEILSKKWKRATLILVPTLASAMAALLNPFGPDVYKESLWHSQYPLRNLISEWVPPSIEERTLIIFGAISVGVLIFLHARKKIFWLLCLILFGYLAFEAKRHLPFFWLCAFLAVIESLENRLIPLEKDLRFKKIFNFALGVGLIFLFTQHLTKTISTDTDWRRYCATRNYPCRAMEFIKANPPEGQNLFTAYEWGGFLEWQLPQYKPFVDGRMPAWLDSPKPSEGGDTPEGKSPYTVYLEIIQAQQGYQKELERYETGWLLIGSGTFLDIELGNKPEQEKIWREVYRDKTSVIYTKQL